MTSTSPPSDEPGRYALDGLDRTIHEKARLGILTSLMTRPEGLLFNELKELCALTDGNLNRHLNVLLEAGAVRQTKEFVGAKPRTTVFVTRAGLKRFSQYLDALRQALAAAQAALPTPARRAPVPARA